MSVLDNKTVLVTGGTGSFGHQMAQELLKHEFKEVRILSRHEDLQHRMSEEFPQFQYVLADVRDYDRIFDAVKGVNIIFHAAALKQVPDCEAHPIEAVKTNIMGAYNVKRAAVERGVEKVVFISTDKAVKPINVMGMAKAIQERIFVSDDGGGRTKFVGVRYGNVLGSRGSVVPHFLDLARSGRHIPLTSPEMTRFFLTLKEAIQLVLFALEEGGEREIFAKKSPAARILDLAEVISDVYRTGIQNVGIRPGEKIHETLVTEDEMRRARESQDHFIIFPFDKYENTSKSYEYGSQTTRLLSKPEIKELLEREGLLETPESLYKARGTR